jgi:hypothetical protein
VSTRRFYGTRSALFTPSFSLGISKRDFLLRDTPAPACRKRTKTFSPPLGSHYQTHHLPPPSSASDKTCRELASLIRQRIIFCRLCAGRYDPAPQPVPRKNKTDDFAKIFFVSFGSAPYRRGAPTNWTLRVPYGFLDHQTPRCCHAANV